LAKPLWPQSGPLHLNRRRPILKRQVYSKRPLRHEYHLTEKGEALYPVIPALRAWDETWFKSPKEDRAANHMHLVCGKPAGLGPLCESCGKPLHREDLVAEQAPNIEGSERRGGRRSGRVADNQARDPQKNEHDSAIGPASSSQGLYEPRFSSL